MTIEAEKIWRDSMAVMFGERDDIHPQELQDQNLSGPGTFARGVWRNKSRTALLSGDPNGMAVSVLHLGKQYANDLSEDGIIYHFPNNRTISQDQADIASLVNAYNAELKIGVISHGKTQKHRKVQFGQITDLSDDRCLILFDTKNIVQSQQPASASFTLNASEREKSKSYERRLRDPMFRYWVEKRCGTYCACCEINQPQLLEAAHIKSVSAGGSDHPLNGLMLCANHYKALDNWLISIQPETGKIQVSPAISSSNIGITKQYLGEKVMPNGEALKWHFTKFKNRHFNA